MYSGSLVALITPFNESGIDCLSLEKLVHWHIDQGTKALVICGTTGEGTLLSDEERTDLIDCCVRVSNKRIPIIVGCSSSSTADSVDLAKEAQALGADGILVMTPFYVKPTQEGIYQHFKTINDQISIPIIVYNHPGRSGLDIKIETMQRIFTLSNVKALKDSNVDMERAKALKAIIKEDQALLSGDDETVLDYLAAGGQGCISVTANIRPLDCQQIMDLWFSGKKEEAHALNDKLMPLHKALMMEPNPQPAKYILYKMGMIQNIIKSPLLMPTEESSIVLDTFL